MKLSEKAINALEDFGIPLYMREGIIRYCEDGVPPDNFLSAVINNDLKKACEQADNVNRYRIFNYMKWLYNHAPMGSWGYPDAVDDWVKAMKEERVA